ncbi:MAG: thiamine phosphate synthase, partial [Rubrobacteraceae bacterium]
MNSMKTLKRAKLLLVTDPRPDLAERVSSAVRGGVDIVQLRDKHASREGLLPLAEELRNICETGGALFTVNDDPELARLSGAAGVHIGQEDGEMSAARDILGPGSIIGRSAGTIEEARRAMSEGADYLGVGSVYPTPTKPDGDVAGLEFIRDLAREELAVPWFAIGGVTLETASAVAEADEILAIADAVMIARGDLGIRLPIE